jgi:hypothetical protein
VHACAGISIVASDATLQYAAPNHIGRLLRLLARGRMRAGGAPADWHFALRRRDLDYLVSFQLPVAEKLRAPEHSDAT